VKFQFCFYFGVFSKINPVEAANCKMSNLQEIKVTRFDDPTKFYFSFVNDERFKRNHTLEKEIGKFCDGKLLLPVVGSVSWRARNVQENEIEI
jgi:hypothetical protein